MSAFHEEMEQRFGSDEALGVVFVLYTADSDADSITVPAADYDSLPEEVRNTYECESQFPDGTSAVCCTYYASQILKGMPGRVKIFGFANENNPTSRVAREEWHPGGHDFAVVDDRYIVDPWPRLVLGHDGPMVYDLQEPDEALSALDIFGPRSCWTHMVGAEEFALSLA